MTYPISITVNVGERAFVLTLEEAEKLRDTLNQILPEKQVASAAHTISLPIFKNQTLSGRAVYDPDTSLDKFVL